jgi:hypothetical protein
MMHSSNDACETHAKGVMTIVKNVASVLKGLAQRRLKAPCTTLISQSVLNARQHHQVQWQNQPQHLVAAL